MKDKETKSTEVTSEELQQLIAEAVENSITKTLGNKEAEKKPESGLETAIVDAIKACNEKIKAKKQEAGDNWTDENEAESLNELVDAILEVINAANEEEKPEEGGEGKGKDQAFETKDIGKVIAEALKSALSEKESKKKEEKSAVQRKYSAMFIGGKNLNTQQNEQKRIPADVQLARAIKCYDVFGKHDPEAAAYHAVKKYGDKDMEREFKTLAATKPSDGGYLIPEIYLDQIIEMLYAKTVIFTLGAQKVPMSSGNLTIPKMTGGVRATWGGEGRKIAKTQPTFGQIKMSAKRLEAIVPQTRELLMSTNYSADQIFANDLTRRMELGLDFGALYGTGGEFQPLGITNNKDVEVLDCASITNTALVDSSDKITADFPVYVRSKAMAKNIDDQRCGWVFNSMMEGYLMNLKTTTGAYIYREEMQNGKLLGFPYKVSNQIPTSSANKTEIIFGNWADLLIGEQLGLETYTTLDGSWVDEAGTQHNAFEENLAATRALMYVDIAARHPESFIVVKNAVIA